MDLSIIIVNWNTRNLLLECLNSVYRTVKTIKMEVWVVDNGSKDGSVAAVAERFAETKFIQNQVNFGFAKANNQALNLAAGKYLLLLNPDTQASEGAVGELISFMDSHPEVGVAGAQLLNSDGSKQNSIANFPSLATELLSKSLLRRLFPNRFPGKDRDYPAPIEVDSVIGACMMVRRDVINQVGLFDEEYFLFLEETDWCYRIKKAGWKIYHVPQAEIYHFQGKSTEAERKRAKVEYYRSRYHFFKKNKGNLQWVILLVALLIRLGFELLSMGVASLVTFFAIKGWRKRLGIYAYLFWWHLRLCTGRMGLKPTGGSL